MQDVECPYCEEWQEINHDDGVGYDEDKTFQQECSDCGKTFVYTTSISFHYNAEKADCLNGKKHDYQPTTTYPKFFTKMRCSMCFNERQPTDKEREKFNIPTKYE